MNENPYQVPETSVLLYSENLTMNESSKWEKAEKFIIAFFLVFNIILLFGLLAALWSSEKDFVRGSGYTTPVMVVLLLHIILQIMGHIILFLVNLVICLFHGFHIRRVKKIFIVFIGGVVSVGVWIALVAAYASNGKYDLIIAPADTGSSVMLVMAIVVNGFYYMVMKDGRTVSTEDG